MAGLLHRLTAFVLQETHPTRLRRLAHKIIQVLYHVAWRAWEDSLLRRAAALSFFTLLNLLPLASLVLFVLSRSSPFQSNMKSVEAALVDQLMTPAAQKVVWDLFDRLSENLSLLGMGASGAVALVTFFFLGTTLIASVESALNEIWRWPGRRGAFVARVSLLWLGVTLLPLLVGISFALSAHFRKGMPRFYLTLHYFVPFLISFIAFLGLYWVTSRGRLKIGPTILASFAATCLFEGAKLGLSRYVQLVFSQSTVEKVYGSLALVPIGMVWIYYSWIIVLLGAELAYVLHHRARLQDEARLKEALGMGFTPLSRIAAIALLLDACEAFDEGLGGLSPADAAARYQLHPDQTERWFAALEEGGFVVRTPSGTLTLARPARTIRLKDVSDLYERMFHGAFAGASDPVRRFAGDEEGAFLAGLGERTMADWAQERGAVSRSAPCPPIGSEN